MPVPLLLHTCCAPCSAAIIEWLVEHDVEPVIHYCNPNIFPQEEYVRRKDECTRYAGKFGLRVIDDDYDHDAWLRHIRGLEHEPERGRRCLQCFRLRLLRSARLAGRLGISDFATTLASSRWKSLDQISQAGRWAEAQVSGTHFVDRNWRKGGLQQRRAELLRENGFYNQTYCGCEFSLRQAQERARSQADARPGAERRACEPTE